MNGLSSASLSHTALLPKVYNCGRGGHRRRRVNERLSSCTHTHARAGCHKGGQRWVYMTSGLFACMHVSSRDMRGQIDQAWARANFTGRGHSLRGRTSEIYRERAGSLRKWHYKFKLPVKRTSGSKSGMIKRRHWRNLANFARTKWAAARHIWRFDEFWYWWYALAPSALRPPYAFKRAAALRLTLSERGDAVCRILLSSIGANWNWGICYK